MYVYFNVCVSPCQFILYVYVCVRKVFIPATCAKSSRTTDVKSHLVCNLPPLRYNDVRHVVELQIVFIGLYYKKNIFYLQFCVYNTLHTELKKNTLFYVLFAKFDVVLLYHRLCDPTYNIITVTLYMTHCELVICCCDIIC